MTQTLEYIIKANATQAKAALADVEKRFGGVQNAAMGVDRTIIALEKDIKDLNAAIAAGGPNVDAYKRALAGLQGAQRNVGHAALEVSRGLEDLQYGLGGVVNNIPGVVMALGGGAGLTAAISLTAVGINQLYKRTEDVWKVIDEADKHADNWKGTLSDLSKTLSDQLNRSLERSNALLREAQTEFKNLGKTSAEVRENELTLEIDANQRRLTNRQQEQEDRKERVAAMEAEFKARMNQRSQSGAEMAELKARIATEKELIAKSKERTAALSAAVEKQKTDLAVMRVVHMGIKNAPPPPPPPGGGRRGAGRTASEADPLDFSKGMADELAYAEKWAEIERKLYADAEKEKERHERERTRLAEAAARERNRIREQEAAHAKQMAEREARYLTQISVNAAAALGEFAAMSALGQEAALANLLSAAAQQAGGIIMLEGSKVVGAGIAGMLAAPNPASAAQIAGGLGLVAAGAAIQTGGPAAVSQLMGMTGSGGGSGDAGGRSDPGASPGRSGVSGSGGPMIINVSYGAGGPLPEDVGREIFKAVRGANRRGGR